MRRHSQIVAALLVLASTTSPAWASKKTFNIHDDLLAFPQFQIHFPDGYILQSKSETDSPGQPDTRHGGHSIIDKHQPRSDQTTLNDDTYDTTRDQEKPQTDANLSYEELILDGQRYLCRIPRVEVSDRNQTKDSKEMNEEDEEKEIARATDRGMELLREMEGKCLYYISGWWSYSFCYMDRIKQFHALPSGGAIPNYPPMEDPEAHSFILGRFPRVDEEDRDSSAKAEKLTTDLAELQTRGGSRYLVQHLDKGDRCDLTGKNRKIEIQFHCNPQSTDRIGWIKELTTCSYLMLVYTPRLCNDVAFLPPQQDEVHPVDCREILTPDDVPSWEAMQDYRMSQILVDSAETPGRPVVGGIEVGAQRLVGSEGRQIEKGRVASAGEEKSDVVAKREKGELKVLSKDELKKFDLDPQKIEDLKNQLEKLAKGKDWTLEFFTANGERGLRGVVDADEDDLPREGEEEEEPLTPGLKAATNQGEKGKKTQSGGNKEEPKPVKAEEVEEQEEAEEGSQEIFKDEL